MKHRIPLVLLAVSLLCLGEAALIFFGVRYMGREPEPRRGFGLFSWKEDAMGQEEEEALAECASQAEISELYQYFSEESISSGMAEDFVRRMGSQGISVYALMGEAEWAYGQDGGRLVEEVRRAAAYNEEAGEEARITGIMADVEPYLLEEWGEGNDARAELMDGFLSCMEQAYALAQEAGLEFLVCIPTFYDSTNPDVLEALIAGACDGVAVMNYNRRDEYGQMAMEVGFAREYGKRIICIFELQEAGAHGLEEINTYAEEGLPALRQSAERLARQFGYEELSFAYHYYEPLKEMLGLSP